jgi:hypothetical protein
MPFRETRILGLLVFTCDSFPIKYTCVAEIPFKGTETEGP